MRGKLVMYRSQYGTTYWARTVKELRELIGGGRVSKMYRDGKDGKPVHIGYVVGEYWCTGFWPMYEPVL